MLLSNSLLISAGDLAWSVPLPREQLRVWAGISAPSGRPAPTRAGSSSVPSFAGEGLFAVGIAVCLATAAAPAHAPWFSGCMPDSIRTPEPCQHFAFGECASVLARACGGTSGCSGRWGRRERGVGCPAEPRRSRGPRAGFPTCQWEQSRRSSLFGQ